MGERQVRGHLDRDVSQNLQRKRGRNAWLIIRSGSVPLMQASANELYWFSRVRCGHDRQRQRSHPPAKVAIKLDIVGDILGQALSLLLTRSAFPMQSTRLPRGEQDCSKRYLQSSTRA